MISLGYTILGSWGNYIPEMITKMQYLWQYLMNFVFYVIVLFLILFWYCSWIQVLDVATSLAKVADVDRNLGNEDAAICGFQEGIKLLDSLTISPGEVGLEQRVHIIE